MLRGAKAIDPEIIREARTLEIAARRSMMHEFSGLYLSAFRGSGLRFREVAEYSDGDDCRTIDWKSSARSHRVLRKIFDEERKRTIIVAVDRSSSMRVPAIQRRCKDAVALLTLAALHGGDDIGFAGLSVDRATIVPPRGRRDQFFRVMAAALEPIPPRSITNLAVQIRKMGNFLKRRALIFLISDFHSPDFSSDLSTLCGRHDVICCALTWQTRLPRKGLLRVEEEETGQESFIDCASLARDQIEKREEARLKQLEQSVHRCGGSSVIIEDKILPPLLELMNTRMKGARR